jgi:hypothetical protein
MIIKKIIGIFVCMMLIVFVIPTSGSIFESNNSNLEILDPYQNYRDKVKHLDDGKPSPGPGEVSPDFVFETNDVVKNVRDPPVKTLQSSKETIGDILEEVDEALILEYLTDLVDFGPRVTGTSACEQAGDYIYYEFKSYGLETRYDDWSYGGNSGNNIEGTLQGTDETSDEIYIICAHYDSVTGSPGADDDGSGTATVLAAAYAMSQYEFNHTIRFVAFDGEEQGLLGSHEYVQEAYDNGDNIVAVLNGDMIGFATNETEASMMKIKENSASTWITNFTYDVSQKYEEYIELTVIPSGSGGGSDHRSFWDFGYHAIMYQEYNFNDYYHSPQDQIGNMDIDYCTRMSRLEIATLGELAEGVGSPETPTKPDGPEKWFIDVEASYSSNTIDQQGDQIYYLFDWGDGNNSGWIGPYSSGQTGEASHVWTELGNYEIKVMAKDNYNFISNWSEPLFLSIVENERPDKVTINGPNWGFGGEEYEFTFVSTDPDEHDLYYRINWDDGDDTGYIGPYASGETITLSHKWKEKGEYWIKVWAKDIIGDKSNQASHKINILTNSARSYQRAPLFKQILERISQSFPVINYILNR